MNLNIRLAEESDLKAYTDLLQKTYEQFYTNPKIGLTKELFSQEIFNTADTQAYLKANLQISENQKTWVALVGNNLVGSITIERKGSECQLRGFYVSEEYQGKGIGKKLWQYALDFSGSSDIVLDLYVHNTKTIEMYKKWGFIIDQAKGTFYRHWPEWPAGVKAKCLYMRLRK